jgi:hypothetical protein
MDKNNNEKWNTIGYSCTSVTDSNIGKLYIFYIKRAKHWDRTSISTFVSSLNVQVAVLATSYLQCKEIKIKYILRNT